METRLSHHGKKTYGFQRNSFTTGVWSGDNQEVKIIPETDINRNGFFLIDQWMTGLAKPDPPSVLKTGSLAFMSMASAARAKIKSSCTMMERSA